MTLFELYPAVYVLFSMYTPSSTHSDECATSVDSRHITEGAEEGFMVFNCTRFATLFNCFNSNTFATVQIRSNDPE